MFSCSIVLSIALDDACDWFGELCIQSEKCEISSMSYSRKVSRFHVFYVFSCSIDHGFNCCIFW